MISRGRRGVVTIARMVRDALIAITIASLLAGIIGQLFNDSITLLIPLMYLPVPLVAAVAVGIDLIRRGRTVRGLRFSLSLIAMISLAIEFPQLFGTGRFDAAQPNLPTVRLLQWNVMWGGRWSAATEWGDISKKVIDRKADIVVLSEVPLDENLPAQLLHRLGDDWHVAAFDHFGQGEYVARLRIFSRYPVATEYSRVATDGVFVVVRIDAPSPIRMMVVDGVSGINDKSPLLKFIADAVNQDGHIDIITGDFNATSRSTGFASIQSQGYRDADNHNLTYRPTWPAMLPIFDIDHLLISQRHRVLNCRSFYSRGSDHRGQYVDLQFNAR
ncbi:MAG: endonuclease/exonuclease/phosphatase family protein [Burkholderiales bacterium]|nr:endonuclease/exonuclease/phosphatase family protein [Phycisphaerae bacterium]